MRESSKAEEIKDYKIHFKKPFEVKHSTLCCTFGFPEDSHNHLFHTSYPPSFPHVSNYISVFNLSEFGEFAFYPKTIIQF